MRSVLIRLCFLVAFLTLLLGIMYMVVQNNHSSEPDVILYDQYDNASAAGWGALSDSFFDEHPWKQAADDFVVPAGQTWVVNQIEVAGIYVYNFNEDKVRSIDIQFYQDANFLPMTKISAQKNLSYTVFPPESAEVQALPVPPIPSPGADTTHGSFLIPINPITLPSGTYWLSVEAVIRSAQDTSGYIWLWKPRTMISNHPAAQRRHILPEFYSAFPDVVANEGWTTWTSTVKCSPDSIVDQCDLVFRLRGQLSSGTLVATETPNLSQPSVILTDTPIPNKPINTAIPILPSKDRTKTSTPVIAVTSTPFVTLTNVPSLIPKHVSTSTPTSEISATPTILHKKGGTPVPPTEIQIIETVAPTVIEVPKAPQIKP